MAVRSRNLLRPAQLQSRRAASQLSAQGNTNWMLAGALGVVGVTSFVVRVLATGWRVGGWVGVATVGLVYSYVGPICDRVL